MRTFEMGGKSYNTLTAIAKELGVKRIYTRDFAKYGIVEVTTANDSVVMVSKSVNILDDATMTDDNAADVAAPDANDNGSDNQSDSADVAVVDDQNDTKDADNPLNTGGSAIIFAHATADGIAVDKVIDIDHKTANDDTKDDASDVPQTVDQDDTKDVVIDAPVADTQANDAKATPAQPQTEEEKIAQIEQDVVDYADADELGKAVRKISLAGLIKMVENIQGDTWERISNEGIRKMRLIMELKKGYFPSSQPKSKSASSGPSPWKDVSTADMKAAATAKGCVWKDCDNEGILRMRLIMVLKAVGVTADELKK